MKIFEISKSEPDGADAAWEELELLVYVLGTAIAVGTTVWPWIVRIVG